MRFFYFLAACLYALSIHSQTTDLTTLNTADGLYLFDKAVVTVSNFDTKEVMLTRAFNDTTALKDFGEVPFPPQPVFLSTYIQNGVLTGCKLWNNGKEYNVQENGHLLVPLKPSDSEAFDVFSQSYYLSPVYKLNIDGNTVTFTFTEPFGSSQYSSIPLEGKFVITLDKDHSN